ncbi:hypothetical protein J2X36_004060 [Methylobacterium sp. BE186]|uniref:hypothetical protein n=1 Tax=Methylobacterium sp. BE186 TaxID=2817715 RepID=UPI0028609B08|nr:hypothetical protein [Methylobacterium sp. BE186]MDR7039286.1 hypothetical protein [Methylobacterium sp. BE186]
MEGGIIWLGIIGAILGLSLLAVATVGMRRHRHRGRAADPDLTQAASGFARLRWLKPRGMRRRS